MSARNEILNTLRQQAHPTPLPPTWTPQPPFVDPIAKFTKALTAVYGRSPSCLDFGRGCWVVG